MVNTPRVEVWIKAATAAQVTMNSALVNAGENPRQGIVDALDAKMQRMISALNYPPWMHENPEEGSAVLDYMKRNERDISELEKGYRNINSPSHSPPIAQLETSFEAQQRPQYRPNTELRPADLKFTMTPEETEGWEVQFKSYYSTSLMETIPIADQQTYLRTCLAADVAADVFREASPDTPIFPTTNLVDGTVNNRDSLMGLIHDAFERRYPLIKRRIDFFAAKPKPNETSVEYITRLMAESKRANLTQGLNNEELVCLKVANSIKNDRLLEKIISEKINTTKNLFEAAHSVKDKAAVVASMTPRTGQSVPNQNSSQKTTNTPSKNSSKNKNFRGPNNSNKNSGGSKEAGPPNNQICPICTGKHAKKQCRFLGKNVECFKCGKVGHLMAACKSEKSSSAPLSSLTLGSVTTVALPIDDVEIRPHNALDWFAEKMFFDSGAGVNGIRRDVAEKIGLVWDPDVTVETYAANGEVMDCLGAGSVDIKYQESIVPLQFFVYPTNLSFSVILGLPSFKNFDLLSERFPVGRDKAVSTPEPDDPATDGRGTASSGDATTKPINPIRPTEAGRTEPSQLHKFCLEEFRDVFYDDQSPPLKRMEGDPMVIVLKPGSVTPSRCPPSRAVPIHLESEAEEEINKHLKMGVIEPVTHPTEWTSPAFFTKKPHGGVRLVTDFSKLNQYVLRPEHPFPSPEEILAWIPGSSRVFARLDCKSGYHQIPLAEESRDLTTFVTTKGRFRYCRAPMGLTSSSDEFCRRTDNALSGLKLKKIVDDILIAADTYADLEITLKSVLSRCRKHNVTLSADKIEIGPQIRFAGYIVSADGVVPDEEKVKAIRGFPPLKSVRDVRSFLGLANQLGEFTPELAAKSAPLRALLKKGVPFTWEVSEKSSFEELKSILTNYPTLRLFDVRRDTVLITDASCIFGIGYALCQIGDGGKLHLIRCGSRSLSPAETRYAPIELEATAIEWAIRRSKLYLLGCSFTVRTDHKPLVGIFRRKDTENPRLQRILAKLDNYHFVVEYIRGKDNAIADALSRYPVDPPEPDAEVEAAISTFGTDPLIAELREAAGDSYREIHQAVKSGVKAKDLPPHHPGRQLKDLWSELAASDDVLMTYRGRIVVPVRARARILEKLHVSHCGETKTLRQARSLYHWPGMAVDVREYIRTCQPCQELLPSKPRPKARGEYEVDKPMEEISVDLFEVRNKNYIAVKDRFTGKVWFSPLKKTKTRNVIECLESIFHEYGYPNVIRSDGGPQFRSEFERYCKRMAITKTLSSPYNPESNGHAESAVKTAKHIIIKTKSHEGARKALFAWNNVPPARSQKAGSPNQLMFGRILRSDLPLPSATGPGNRIPGKEVQGAFQRGDQVVIQDPLSKRWNRFAQLVEPRSSGSWIFRDEDDVIGLRSTRFIRRRYANAPKADVANKPEVPIPSGRKPGRPRGRQPGPKTSTRAQPPRAAKAKFGLP